MRAPGRQSFAALLACLACCPQLRAAGEHTVSNVTLDARSQQGNPIVHSFAKSVLYDGSGNRIYDKQLILGHQVSNNTIQAVVYSAQIDSPIGYANSSTGDFGGNHENCYSARMSSHVNAYNLHTVIYTSEKCIPPPLAVDVPKENCPILIDVEQDGFHLSGPVPAVAFDIDADGSEESIAWTAAGEDDAFLCMDRNGNGLIDNGAELFGYSTPLSSGKTARVGYRALAELDNSLLGGNADGVVSASDEMFGDLCAWTDSNRDGKSQAAEISTLDEIGVAALEYDFKTIRVRDPYGNLFRYTSQVEVLLPTGGTRLWPTYDVIFGSLK